MSRVQHQGPVTMLLLDDGAGTGTTGTKKVTDRGRIDEGAAALESMPRICSMITAMWGYPEFKLYMERLILVESSRIERAGFPETVSQELLFLYRLFMDHSGILSREAATLSLEQPVEHTDTAWVLAR